MKQKSLVLVHYCKIFLVISNTLWITYNDILMCLICLQLFWPTVARSSCTIYKAFNNHPCQGNNLNLVILKQYTSMELFSVRRYRQNCWTNCPLCTVPIILTIYTITYILWKIPIRATFLWSGMFSLGSFTAKRKEIFIIWTYI